MDAPVTPEVWVELREAICAQVFASIIEAADATSLPFAERVAKRVEAADAGTTAILALLRATDAAPDRQPQAVRAAALEEGSKHRKPWRSLDDLMSTSPDVVAAYFIPGDPPDVVDAIRRTWGPEKPRPPMQLQLEDVLRRMVASLPTHPDTPPAPEVDLRPGLKRAIDIGEERAWKLSAEAYAGAEYVLSRQRAELQSLPAQQSRQDEPGAETLADASAPAVQPASGNQGAGQQSVTARSAPWPPAASDRASGVTDEAEQEAIYAYTKAVGSSCTRTGMRAALEAARGVAAPSISGAPASRQEAEAALIAYDAARGRHDRWDGAFSEVETARARLLDMMVGGSASREVERLRAALKRFGKHKPSCNAARALPFELRGGQVKCSCGFQATLATPGADTGGKANG